MPHESIRSPSASGHGQALDGLRGVAVLLVFGLHLGVTGFGGGHLGVDVFFVLSGFLITTLLLDEMQETGGIRVASFWARRARRLLPALVLLLLVVAFATWLFATFSERSSLRGDLLWTTGYLANWHFIATSSYFVATGVESPLQHTWSLAIEEQCSSDARTSVATNGCGSRSITTTTSLHDGTPCWVDTLDATPTKRCS